MTITLTFEGQVTAKKNSKQISRRGDGRLFLRSSDAAKAQEQLMVAAFWSQYAKVKLADRQKFQVADSYEVVINVWNRDRRRHDLGNQEATIMDALVKAGVLRDDNQNVVPAEMLFCRGVDKLYPRAEITITTLKKGEFENAN